MKKLLIVGIVGLLLQGCSFAKDGSGRATVEKNVEVKSMSVSQKNLLAAVRGGDVESLEIALSRLEPYEYSFAGYGDTPMGLALKLDRLAMAEILRSKNVDPFNLGEQGPAFEKLVVQYRAKDVFRKIGHLKKAALIKAELSSTGAYINGFLLDVVSEVVTQFTQQGATGAKSLVEKSGLSCSFVRNAIIQKIQTDDESDDMGIVFIKALSCSEEIGANEAQVLYESELIRQFQRYFRDADLLGYLSHLPKLRSIMWNIDDSGILLSPQLLIRISWSEDNVFAAKDSCPPPTQKEGDQCEYYHDTDFIAADALAKKIGLKKSRFELIETRDGKVVASYRRFVRHAARIRSESDPVFFFTSLYCSGKTDYSEISPPMIDGHEVDFNFDRIPWRVGLQSKADGVRTSSMDLDEAQWLERQEATQLERERAMEEDEDAPEVRGDDLQPAPSPSGDLGDLPEVE